MANPILKAAALAARTLPEPVKKALYRLGPATRLLRGALNRAAPSGPTVTEVAGGDLAGMRLLLDLQTEKDFWLGTYEPELQRAIRDLVPSGATIYDVGANIGYISLLLARAAGPTGRVFAFEALPDNLDRLRRNLGLNPSMPERIAVVGQAVTGQTGLARFLVHASVGMGKVDGSAGRAETYAGAIEVPAVCLDDFVFAQGNPPPQVIKIDIEGGEVLALPGMQRTLAAYHPLLLMEMHGPESASAAWETLVPLGYRLSRMEPGYPPVSSLEELDWKAYLVARSV